MAISRSEATLPAAALQSEGVRITLQDYLNGGSWAYGLTCVAPSGVCDGTRTKTPADLATGYCASAVDVAIPASGQAYVNLHLDYGLEGPQTDACGDGNFPGLSRFGSPPAEEKGAGEGRRGAGL